MKLIIFFYIDLVVYEKNEISNESEYSIFNSIMILQYNSRFIHCHSVYISRSILYNMCIILCNVMYLI